MHTLLWQELFCGLMPIEWLTVLSDLLKFSILWIFTLIQWAVRVDHISFSINSILTTQNKSELIFGDIMIRYTEPTLCSCTATVDLCGPVTNGTIKTDISDNHVDTHGS